MPSDRNSVRATLSRALRQLLPWALALAVATCADDQNGPTRGGVGYFAFKPVYAINGSLSQFGIVADSVHVRLTRPVNQVVLDTTVFFPPDSTKLRLALPIVLETSPETLTAVIGISSGATLLFTDSLDVAVIDGPPSAATIPTVILDYVGPGKNVAAITVLPGDTTVVLQDTLFFTATATDSSAQPVASFFVGWKTSDTTVAKINGQGRLIAPNLRGTVKVIGTTPTGISDTTTLVFAPVPSQITADSGTAQTGIVPDSLGALFVARVLGSDNLPIDGIKVRWTAVTVGGAVRDTILFTDVNGRVRTRGVLGDTARVYSYTASVVGTALTTTFTATATAGAPSAIALQGGTGQVDSAGRSLPLPLATRVTDAYGNPVSGAKVYWARTLGGGTVSADSTVTDAAGLTSISYTLGAVGTDSVTATLAGTSATAKFGATAINGAPATVAKSFGDLQTDTVARLLADSLVVVVKSATNQPVVAGPVVWTILHGGSTSLDTSFTDVNGRSAVAYTLGTLAGNDSIQAKAGNVSAVFHQTALAGAPTQLVLVSGDNQLDTAGVVLGTALQVRAKDALGNGAPGATIVFARLAGTGTLTSDTLVADATGLVSNSYHLGTPGIDSVRATLLGGGASVVFHFTTVAPAPAAVVLFGGDLQIDTVSQLLGQALDLRVLGAGAAPVEGRSVQWTVLAGGGAVDSATSTTDVNGHATTRYTTGSTAGTAQIEAFVVGTTLRDTFTVTQVADAPSAIAILGGNGQTDTTGHLLPLPFSVKVTDAHGNAISGAKVYWTQVAGSGTRSADSTVTDGTGQTSITYTLGAVLGTDSVRATVAGTAASVDFTAGTVSAAPTAIQVVFGNNQVDTVGATLVDSLIVRLADGGNNPIPNTWLYWQTAGITLSADSTKTDANGRAAVQAVLGTAAAKLIVLVRNVDTTLGGVFNIRVRAGHATTITPLTGDGQSGAVNTALALPFRVILQDAHGNPADSQGVAWTRLVGTGVVVPDTATTDTLGMASASYTLGATAGTDSIQAKIVGAPEATVFTAFATAGAPAAMTYVSGTGQSDTVGATLTNPFVVQVKDGANNPVPGVMVHFTRIRGFGTVVSDSNVTSASGVASTGYVLSGTVGLDSVIATIGGLPDTVAFYAQTTVGAPQQIVKIAGDSQSAALGATLPSPLRTDVTDRFGNPIAGVTVDFVSTTAGAVTFATPSPTSDAAGFAATGTVTIGAAAGSFDVTATASAIPGDTLHFTVVALPIGTSKQWTGALSSVWGTAGNWSPSGVPTAADNVFVPASAPSQPVLDAARSVGGFQVESGATVALGAFNLTTGGATQVDGAMSHTTGLLILNGSATSARGNFTATRVTGTLTLAAATTIADSLSMTAGSLNVGGQTLAINGALDITGSGAFTMQNPADSVTVTGPATWNGSTAAGLLTAGALVLHGDLSVPTGSAVFQGNAGHRTIFAGSAAQTVTFSSATLAGDRFGDLVIENPSGVTLGGNIAVAGDVLINTGVVTGAGRTATLNAGLFDPTSTGWNVATTSVAGIPSVFPDTILGNLDVAALLPLSHGLVVKGNYTQNSGTFAPNGFPVRIDGTTTLTGTAAFQMQSPSDSVDLVGAVSWNGTTTAGLLTHGTLVLRSGFTVPTGSAVFQASGTHTTVFAGATAQQVNVSGAAVGTNYFNDLVIANPAGVQLQSNIATFGRATVVAGTLTGAHTAFIGTGVADPSNVSWLPDMTEFTGSVTVLPDSLGKGVTISGGVGLNKALVVKGPVSVIGTGSFLLNSFSARLDSTFTVTGSAQVGMMNPADSLDIAGTVSWNGSTASGLLGAGKLVLRGDFNEPSGASVFQANGSHQTILAGTAPQAINFGGPSLTGNRFNHLTVANAAGVTLGNNMAVAGNAAIVSGTLTGVGRTVFLNGDLSDPSNVSWNPDVTELDGTPTVLPDSFSKGLTISGTVTLGHGLVVKGPYNGINSGVLALNGFKARFDGLFTVTGSHQVKLLNAADTLDIAGTASWNGSTATGLLTAGTTIYRGNFSEPSGASVYQPSGTHTSVFAGVSVQTINFGATGYTGNRFNHFVVNNASGVSLASNVAIAGNATLQSGTVTGAGRTVFVNGDLSDPTNVSWNPDVTEIDGTPTVFPDSFTNGLTVSGTLVLGHGLVVKGPFNAINSGVFTLNGFKARLDSSFALSGGHQVKLQNSADTLDIAGSVTWNGSTNAGLLTAGTTIFRGNFSEPSGARVYSATGTHKTVFAGSAAQTVAFGGPTFGANELHDVDFANPAGVTLTSNIAINGTAKMVAGAMTATGHTALLSGTVVDTIAGWRPDFTVLSGNFPVLPDSFLRNLELQDSVLLTKTLVVKGNLLQSQGRLTLGGHALRVDSALTVSGSAQFVMQNAADTADIAGAASWNGSTTAGLLTAGHLILRGDFSEPSGSSVFQPSGAHTVVFAGAKTHTVTFGAPSVGGNRFNRLRFETPDTLALGSDLVVVDSLAAVNGVPVRIGSTAGVRSVATQLLAMNQVTFDSVQVRYSGGPIGFFYNVTFQHQDPTAIQFAIKEPGSATPDQLQNVQFLTAPTTGKYMSVQDTAANGAALTVQMYHSFPLDGSALTQSLGGGEGASVDWSAFKFLIQPVGAGVLGILDTVQVQVRAPDGNPDANFNGSVTLAIGANPGGATLGGTTTVAATLGVAKFGDLTLSAAGIGYTLVATTAGIAPDTSTAFDITVPLPVGFSNQWLGTVDNNWFNAANWSAGTVPDSSTNTFISGVAAHTPTLLADSAFVKRLQVAAGGKLTLNNGTKLVADSSVEVGDTIQGGGALELRGTGAFTGTHLGTPTMVTGTYSVAGSARAWDLEITGNLTVAADTLSVDFLLQTSGNGQLHQTDPASLVDVVNSAGFNANVPDAGLVDGTLRIQGTISAFGGIPDPFTPSGNHVTEFVGAADHVVNFFHPDTVGGSHFANVRVNGTGRVTFGGRIAALGQIQVLQGTLADSLGQGLIAYQGVSVASGASLAMGGELRSAGPVTVAVGGSYAVPITTYFGAGAPITIDAIPYDTLQVQRAVTVGADFLVTGDLRISNGGADPGRFDLKGHAVTVNGNVNVNGDGALVEQNAADHLTVAGDFFTNGANTEGLLTAGVLQVAGNFRQAADFSGGAYRASTGHVTRFTAGAGHRTIKFDSPINGPSDSSGSKFGDLELLDGVDSLSNNGVFAQRVTLGGSLEYDTAFGGEFAALDSMIVTAGAGTVHLSQLDLYNGIALAGGPTYAVGTTAFFGGTTLPVLPYQSVLISGPALTMTGNVTATGSFGVGQTGEVGGTAGDLIVNGHTLHIGGSFATGGFGLLTMAAGDSVDVGADINFNGGNTAGHLTGGTLVGRGTFSANNHSSDSTFVAGKAHRTVLMDTLASTIYVNAASESGMQFGKLYLLDGAPRTINSFGAALVVQDSLVLGSATSGLSGSAIRVQGPVFTVGGSSLSGALLEVDSTLVVNGSFAMANTQFGGQNQAIPALPYASVTVTGTAFLTDSMVLPAGATMNAFNGDLRVNGKVLRAPQVIMNGTGTLTMTNPADTVDVGSLINWFGASEVGKLTEGVLLVHGQFDVSAGTSDSSFYATGNHVTRFTDSTAVVKVFASAPMATGASRFNKVEITGSGAGTGVMFVGPVWIAGNVTIFSPTIDPITGSSATLGGTLTDVGAVPAVWAVDTTTFLTHQGAMPAKVGGSVVFNAGVGLLDSLEVGGFVHVAGGALTPNGHHLVIHGDLTTTGLGTFGMGALDTVRVDSSLVLTGGGLGSNFLGGLLSIGGSINAPIPGAFDASPAHQTVMDGIHQRTVVMGSGNAFGKFDYSDSTYLLTDVHVRGRLTGSGETAGVLGGVDSLLTLDDSVAQGVEFTNVRVRINESHPLFDVTFQEMNPARTQVTMVGAGAPTPVNLSVIRFHTLPSTGHFVDAVDTLANGDSLIVRMIQSAPIQGDLYGGGSGEGAVRWGKLTFLTLPVTVDSAVPFIVAVAGVGPDGLNYAANTALDIALASNPAGDALQGTLSQGWSFGMATFTDLVLTKPVAGVSFHVAAQVFPSDTTAALDSATSAPITVFNPVPLGAIIWDGSAANGLWSDTANWSGGLAPGITDSIFIPASQSVTFDTTVTIGGLVLGQNATLQLQHDLTVTGRVAAGNTISSAGGNLILAGANQPVSGTLPTTVVTGTISLNGRTAINGDLTIDGAGAELNVAGQRIDISNTLTTQNGGILTMDGADTVFTANAAFNGGDETNKLIDGLFVLQGTSLTQGGPTGTSFKTGGTFTLLFGDAGAPSTAFLNDPANSNFAHVMVQNHLGTDLSGNSGNDVMVLGDLNVSAGGVVHGPQVHVTGNVTSTGPSDTVGFGTLKVDGALAITGGYSVINTNFTGTGQVVPALPYQSLILAGGNATLGADVVAGNVFVTDTMFAIGGHTLRTPFLNVQNGGRLVMTGALDTVIVDTTATIQGGDQTGLLTAGGLVINGDLNLSLSAFRAAPGFTTRFASGRTHHLSASISFEGFPGPGVDWSNHLGSVVVIGDTVIVTDPGHVGFQTTGALDLIGGTWVDSVGANGTQVHGVLHADVGSAIASDHITMFDSLVVANPATYNVLTTGFAGTGQRIPALPYQRVIVGGTGTVALDTAVTTQFLWVQDGARLTMAGHALTVDTSLFVNDSAHLEMHTPTDILNVLGTATFQGGDATGDMTNGIVRARHFIQQVGTSGSDNGFVQTGFAQVAPQAGDTIEMNPVGPAGSRISYLDLWGTGDTVHLGNVWVADSLGNGNPATVTATLTGANNLTVMGDVRWLAGTLHLDTLAIGGTLTVDSLNSTYQVALTKFVGPAQTIPADVPYADIQVYYPALLGGDIRRGSATTVAVLNSGDLDLNGHYLKVRTFRTGAFGTLTMTHPGDSLETETITMGGGSTVGHLTDGAIFAYEFDQLNTTSDSSYAPSGAHAFFLSNVGSPTEVGAKIQFATPGASYFNILGLYAAGVSSFDKPKLWSDVIVHDTLYMVQQLDALGQSIDAQGDVVVQSTADIRLGNLTVHGLLTVDPAATYNINFTDFAPGAGPIPAVAGYHGIVVEGDQTLTTPITFSANLFVRGNGSLTPNGNKITGGSGLYLQDYSHLVMTNPADTIDVGTASFDGAPSGTNLAAGVLRLQGGLTTGATNSAQPFAPTGMVTEFYGGGLAPITMANVSPSGSYLGDLRVVGGTTIQPAGAFLVLGPTTFKDGSTFDGNASLMALEFRGKTAVLDTSKIIGGPSTTIFWEDSLTVATPGNYLVANTEFINTNGIPDLPYQYLTLADGVHDTLTHPLTASSQLNLVSSASGMQDLVLNGHPVTTGFLSLGGFGRFTMTNALDSMRVSGDAIFGGDTLTNRFNNGLLEIGGNFTQAGSNPRSFAPAGGATFFTGISALHQVSFQNPVGGGSSFGSVYLKDGGTIQMNSPVEATGAFYIEANGSFFLGAGHYADFFGLLSLGPSSQFVATDPTYYVNLYNNLIVDPSATWNVVNTGFATTNALPNLSYQNLALGDQTFDTLAFNLNVTGALILNSSNPADQDFVLNGHTVTVGGDFATGTNGRLSMVDPSDALLIAGSADFNGGDLTGHLTAGVIQVGQNFSQEASTSDKSFRSTGTTVQFTTSNQNVTFATPDSSWFTNITGLGAQLSLLLQSDVKATGNITAQTTIINGPGRALTADSITSTSGFLAIGLAKVTAGYMASASAAIYTVPYTNITGSGEAVPLNFGGNFNFDTLEISGNDTLVSHDVLANWIKVTGHTVINNGFTMHATNTLAVDGATAKLENLNGLALADSLFTTVNGGTYISQSAQAGATFHNTVWNGGNEIGMLTAGGMDVTGDFSILTGGPTFRADSLFVVTFDGGGTHDLNMDIVAPGQYFGELGVLSEANGSDTLHLTFAGDLGVYKLSASNGSVFQASGNGIQAEQLAVNNATFSEFPVEVVTNSDQPMSFDNVTFENFSASAIQLNISHPGSASPFTFSGIDFDNIASGPPTGGRFVLLDNNGASLPKLTVGIYGPDYLSFTAQAIFQTGNEVLNFGLTPP